MGGVTAELIGFARGITSDAIPDDAATVAKHCVLDWLGCAIGGSREPLTKILLEDAPPGDAPVIGHDTTVAPEWAALVNGAAGHALDYDDTHLLMSGHPTAPVLPAVLALAARSGASGKDVLAAFVAGVEVECRLGALLPAHYGLGFHGTATLGTFGAAAACAHLLGLGEDGWAHALGLAGTQAAGVRSSFGTMAKPFHAGRAAQSGLMAATLASRGFTADTQILDSPQGFAGVCGGGTNPAALARLGDRFCIRDTLFKYHAACYLTHASIEASLQLREEFAFQPQDIEGAEVHVPPGHLTVCCVITEPRTGLEGKFSVRHTTAMALRGGPTDDAAFTDEKVTDPAVSALRDRVEVHTDDSLRPAESRVVVRLREATRTATVDTGIPAADLDRQWARLTAKFAGLVGEDRAPSLIARVEHLDEAASVGSLDG